MYLTYVSHYSIIFTFLYSSYMKETEWINCFPQNLTKSQKIAAQDTLLAQLLKRHRK